MDEKRCAIDGKVSTGLYGEGYQTPRFWPDGVWQNGSEDKFAEQVRAMKPGDRIAIKATFARKHGPPFDNKGKMVSAMKIKAIGTVTSSHGDGPTVDVAWDALANPRESYFYTYRTTITRARVEDEVLARRLVAFTFDGAPQDYAFFMGQPYWRDRFMAADAATLGGESSDEDTETLDEFEEVPPVAIMAQQTLWPKVALCPNPSCTPCSSAGQRRKI